VSQNDPQLDQTARTAALVGQIGCVTGFASIIIIGIAFVAGRFLDSLLETGGLLTVLFLVGSFPITLYVIVRISLAAVARAQRQPGQGKESTAEEEKSND
jgi:hypothetical protein